MARVGFIGTAHCGPIGMSKLSASNSPIWDLIRSVACRELVLHTY